MSKINDDQKLIRRRIIEATLGAIFTPFILAVPPTSLMIIFPSLRLMILFIIWIVGGGILLLGSFLKTPVPEVDSVKDEVWTPVLGIIAVLIHILIIIFLWRVGLVYIDGFFKLIF